MPWELKADRPIYTQLLEQIQIRIVTGTYPPGSQLASVRDLASEAAVNPNTMQRAMAELERMGLVYARRTAGRFITDDMDVIRSCREAMVGTLADDFCRQMRRFGLSEEEILETVRRANERLEQSDREGV